MTRPQHPFDLSLRDLADLKIIFPQCNKFTRMGGKSVDVASKHGVKISVLIRKMKEKLNVDNIQVHQLLNKIDHKSQDTITWSEFLKFLYNQGLMREVVNDARIYGFGVKRFEGGPRMKMRSKGSITDHFIESLDIVMPLFQGGQFYNPRKNIRSSRPSTTSSNIVTPTPQQQSVFTIWQENPQKSQIKVNKAIFQGPGGKMSKNRKIQSTSANIQRPNKAGHNKRQSVASRKSDLKDNSLLLDQDEYLHTTTSVKRKVIAAAQSKLRKPFGINPDFFSSDSERNNSKTDFKRFLDNIDDHIYSNIEFDNMPAPQIQNLQGAEFLYPQTSQLSRQNTSGDNLSTNHNSPSNAKKYYHHHMASSSAIQKSRKNSSFINSKNMIKRGLARQSFHHAQSIASIVSQGQNKKKSNFTSKNTQLSPNNLAVALQKNRQRLFSNNSILEPSVSQYKGNLSNTNQNLQQRDDSPERMTQDQLIEKSNDLQKSSSSYNGVVKRLNNCYVRISSDSAYASASRKHASSRIKDTGFSLSSQPEWRLDGKQKRVSSLFNKRNNNVSGYTQEGAKQLDHIKSSSFLNVMRNDKNIWQNTKLKRNKQKAIETIKTIVNKSKKADDESSHHISSKNIKAQEAKEDAAALLEAETQTKRIQPVATAYNTKIGLLVVSLIDRETMVYQIKQNGASITLKKLYKFEMPFIASTLDIAFHAINSDQLLLIAGGQDGTLAVYQLDYEKTDDQQQRNRLGSITGNQPQQQQNNQLMGTSNTFQHQSQKHSEFKQSSSVTSPSVSKLKQTVEEKRAKKFGKPIFKVQTHACEIIKVKYVKQLGIIVAGYYGILRILEPMNYKDLLSDINKKDLQTITAMDYSKKQGVIALGGVQGKLLLFDPTAEGPVGSVKAYTGGGTGMQFLDIYFYDEQLQLITISVSRQVCIFDSNRLECLQRLKDSFHSLIPFRSSCFDIKRGNLYTSCQFVKVWKAKVDPSIELKVLQISALSRDANDQKNKKKYHSGTLQEQDLKQFSTQLLKDMAVIKAKQHEYVRPVPEPESTSVSKTQSVLVDKRSTLISLFLNEKKKQLLTVDSQRLVRIWDLKSGQPENSYSLDIEGRLTAASVSENNKFIAVGTECGQVKIFNRSSGGLLYTLSSPATTQRLQITSLAFLRSISEYWLAGTAWKGKVMMWMAPNPTNNYQVNGKAFIAHHRDVLCIDSCQAYVATGATDNIVTVWNAFSGTFRFALSMPQEKESFPSVVQLKFIVIKTPRKYGQNSSVPSDNSSQYPPSPGQSPTSSTGTGFMGRFQKMQSGYKVDKSIYLIVLQSNGSIHVVDPAQGTIAYQYAAQVGENARMDLDKDQSRVMAVDDQGKARIFDISVKDGNILGKSGGKSTPQRAVTMGGMRNAQRWTRFRTWQAHKIIDPEQYVVCVKASSINKFWVTATTNGQVKLWNFDGEYVITLCKGVWPEQSVALQIFNDEQEGSSKEILSSQSEEGGSIGSDDENQLKTHHHHHHHHGQKQTRPKSSKKHEPKRLNMKKVSIMQDPMILEEEDIEQENQRVFKQFVREGSPNTKGGRKPMERSNTNKNNNQLALIENVKKAPKRSVTAGIDFKSKALFGQRKNINSSLISEGNLLSTTVGNASEMNKSFDRASMTFSDKHNQPKKKGY